AICQHGGITREELARRIDAINADVKSAADWIWEQQRKVEEDKYGVEETAHSFKPEPIAEQRMAHVILPRVSDDVAFAFRSLASEWPGMFEVQDSRRRENPWSYCSVVLSRSSLPA